MQIAPIPTLDDELNQIRLSTADIVANQIIPNENILREPGEERVEVWRGIVEKVRQAGLWAPHLPEEAEALTITL